MNNNQPKGDTTMTAKYQVIGSISQVAMTDGAGSLNFTRRFYKPARFSNGREAVVVQECRTRRDAMHWLTRSESMLAYVSGRLGRWITPSFVIVEAR